MTSPRTRNQQGFTLVELLLAMTMSLVVCGSGLMLISTVAKRNYENSNHADKVQLVQVQLERVTRELRQANWLMFSSSLMVDIDVPVRVGGTTSSRRHVRYDCTTGGRCLRLEGPPTGYPPPASSSFDRTDIIVTDLRAGSAVFTPHRVDAATGNRIPDYTAPNSVGVAFDIYVPDWARPVRLQDGIMLRNATTFRG